jgi:hypothetical protein
LAFSVKKNFPLLSGVKAIATGKAMLGLAASVSITNCCPRAAGRRRRIRAQRMTSRSERAINTFYCGRILSSKPPEKSTLW